MLAGIAVAVGYDDHVCNESPAAESPFEPPPGQARRLLGQYVDLLLAENQRLNLTAIREPEAAWRLHVLDSLAALPAVTEVGGAPRILDLGTGGGAPGIPLACVLPPARVLLVDSVGKKIEACRRIVAALGLNNVTAVTARAEELAHAAEYRESFDVVTARAVAALPLLLEWAVGFLRVGGHCLCFKSTAALQSEEPRARQAARVLKLTAAEPLFYELPGEAGRRVILRYIKVDSTGSQYPRRGGAAKRPL